MNLHESSWIYVNKLYGLVWTQIRVVILIEFITWSYMNLCEFICICCMDCAAVQLCAAVRVVVCGSVWVHTTQELGWIKINLNEFVYIYVSQYECTNELIRFEIIWFYFSLFYLIIYLVLSDLILIYVNFLNLFDFILFC